MLPISRNSACPCGSGRKYKSCHGSPDASPPGRHFDTRTAAQLSTAATALRHGNLQKSELICRDVLEQAPDDPTALLLLGHIALRVGRPDFATKYYDQALHYDRDNIEAKASLQRAKEKLQRQREDAAVAGRRSVRYLVIKAWGNGFWSDVDHVAGQLLLADMTGRVPIVHWGTNSLFTAPGIDNAFELYFRPVSASRLTDAARSGATFFPSKWRHDNLHVENLNKWAGDGSRISGLYGLNREEDVLVSDFHTSIHALMPWIGEESSYFGLDLVAIYRRLFAERLVLQPHLQDAVERAWAADMAGGQWLAVHVRGSDKILEAANLANVNDRYFDRIEEIIDRHPSVSLFLLTDSEHYLRVFEQRYGRRLRHRDCTRTATAQGVHYAGHPGRRIAEEVIVDTYLAARCDLFVGNGSSNVSTTVGHLKNWPADSYSLFGENRLAVRDLTLYSW